MKSTANAAFEKSYLTDVGFSKTKKEEIVTLTNFAF